MNYLDFEIEVVHVGGREYEVASRSPAGEARGMMRFPFDDLALKSRLQDLHIALMRSGRTRRRIPSPQEQAVQSFGLDLFNFLIAGDVRAGYDVSQREAVGAGKGLRLVLRIRDPQLAALPWEFLYDPRKAEYVCLSRHTPIVRYTDLVQPVQPLAVQPPLRILGMAVSPNDLDSLDMEREKQRVQEAVRRLQGLVTLKWLGGRTWRDIQDEMQGGPWHIFHFIGHGGFDRRSDEGFIALADDDGRTFELSATKLARLLDHPYLKLVLLNACEGAHSSDLDVFSSTASILVRSGIPSVLAMQYEITDDAAIEFSRSFYRAVARGMSIEAAVSEARKAVSVAISNTVEWGTPVLYLRAPDGHLFDVDLRREHIDAIYNDAKKAVGEEDWDAAIEKLSVVLNCDPAHDEARTALSHAVARRSISELYAEAQAHFQAGRLQEALSCLMKVKAAAGDYRDTVSLITRIEGVFKEERITALRGEAEDLAARGDFAEAIAALESALSLGAAGAEVGARLNQLREERELASLYAEGLRHYDERRWPEALELFKQIEARASDYRDVNDLASDARLKLRAEEEERRRRARVEELRLEADRAAAAEDWDAADEKLRAILNLDPSDTAAASRLKEVGQRKRLAALYDRARMLYERGRWQEALVELQRVSEIAGDYKDTGVLISSACGELEKVRSEARRWERIKRLHLEVEEALDKGDWAKAAELLRVVPKGADSAKVAEYLDLIERGQRPEPEEPPEAGDGVEESQTLTVETIEPEPSPDVPAPRLPPPAAWDVNVKWPKLKKWHVVILCLIPLTTAAVLMLFAFRRDAPPLPNVNNVAPNQTPPPKPPEVEPTPPSLTIDALGELSAGHDLLEVTFNPDGRTLAAVGNSDKVSLWRVDDRSPLPVLKAAAAPSRSIAISPDGATVAAGDDFGNIRLWRMGGDRQAFKTLRGHGSWVFSVAFGADGQSLTSISGDGNVRRWRVGDGKELESIKLPPRHLVVALAPDLRTVALYLDSRSVKGSVSLWSLDERRTLGEMAAGSQVSCGAFSPDGGVLAMGNLKGVVQLWRVSDGSLLFQLKAAKGVPQNVTFSPDGRVVAVGWRDGFIRLWRASDGSLLKEWKGHEGAVKHLSFSGDGKTLVSGGGRKLILWRVSGN